MKHEISQLLSRLKYLGEIEEETNIDDLLYNLNVIIGFFNAIKHYGASNTVWRAEQVIKDYVD